MKGKCRQIVMFIECNIDTLVPKKTLTHLKNSIECIYIYIVSPKDALRN